MTCDSDEIFQSCGANRKPLPVPALCGILHESELTKDLQQ